MSNKPNPVITAFIEALEKLNSEIKKYPNFNNNLIDTHWALPPLSINDILKLITNNIKIAEKFNSIGVSTLEKTVINLAVDRIQKLINSIQYFPNIENNFNYAVNPNYNNYTSVYVLSAPSLYSISLFILWLDKNVGSIFQEFEKQQIQANFKTIITNELEKTDSKVLPKNLVTKLNDTRQQFTELLPEIDKLKLSVQQQIDKLIPNQDELREKIRLINEAQQTAGDLPKSLEMLKKNQEKVTQYRETVEADHKAIELLKAEIEQLRNELKTTQTAHETELSTQKMEFIKQNESQIRNAEQHFRKTRDELDEYIWETQSNLNGVVATQSYEAEKLIEKAAETLSIATSVGLSKAFNKKAFELQMTIIAWVGGLLLILGGGTAFSYFRFNSLMDTLKDNPQWEIVTMQIVVAILSLGAPLWFSWLATKQISQRFRLAEDYAFKAAVALAYEGYKREAEKLGDDNALKQRLFNAALTRLEESPLRLLETQKSDNGNMPWLTMSDVKELWKKAPDIANILFTQIKNAKDLISKDKSSEKKETPKETPKSDKKDE